MFEMQVRTLFFKVSYGFLCNKINRRELSWYLNEFLKINNL